MKFWYNQAFRQFVFQCVLIALLALGIYKMIVHLQYNLQVQGMHLGLDFLNERAGFSIIMHLIDYSSQSTYLRAFWVGLTNTLFVSAIGIVLATIIGLVLGVASLAHHKGISRLARGVVEVVRNIPLLLQIFFWYFAVLRAAPFPQQALHLKNWLYITNRGIYLPKPIFDGYVGYGLIAVVLLMIVSLFLKKQRKLFGLLISLVLLACLFWQLNWQLPTLNSLNFTGGITVLPEFLALLLALSIYTGGFISEIVRLGILSVSKGQKEAALALGLTHFQSLKLIILPQAMKVMLPLITNQYLNLVKNSSLAAAIAYPDLVSVFAGTVLNQTGRAVEIIGITMAVYLFINVVISLSMLWYERRTTWGH